MSEKKVPVTFLKSWRGYNAGEVAAFPESVVADLEDGGVAECGKGTTVAKGAKGGGVAGGRAGKKAGEGQSPAAPHDGQAGLGDGVPDEDGAGDEKP
ncbi:hypothetical protein R2389_000879 [Pseudomonas aeruginosa]|uniref:hypothetical protein n=1 Tax=Pseudomonas aeruginosa TaxID=287 RepID=UPI00070D76B2|nr:hypothetical protein [Pseudomonas aeruginosa]ELQ7354797.1 hypothetical protein [Pseudomonas aeruginosa]MBG4091615.1 hypothetical protein [Pseudomonas aeruginosa]HCL3291046.1 hypothetical protein [Pseudomonas aeruginosa]